MKRAALLIAALLMALTPALPARSQLKAVVGATLIDASRAMPLEDAVVLVQDAKITRVGTRKDTEIPSDAEVIHADGAWLIPGLVDAHVHFFQSGGLYTRPDVIDLRGHVPYQRELAWIRAHLKDTFARYVRCGVTSAVDLGGPMWNFEVRRLAEATALAPRVAVAGPLISTYQPEELLNGDPPIIKAESPQAARTLVQHQAKARPDLIKVWFIVRRPGRPQDHLPVIRAAIDEAHRLGFRVVAHATELETAWAALWARADILAHSVDDGPMDRELIRLLKARRVIYITTLTVNEGYREVLSQQIRLSDADKQCGNPHVIAAWDDLSRLPRKDVPPWVLAQIRQRPRILPNPIALGNLRALQEAGVVIAAGSDAGNIGTLHSAGLHRELELMAQAGLTPLQVLTAATLNGARVMGRERELGSIEPGKLADLVILNSDPLKDIRNLRDIRYVIKGGVLYPADQILDRDVNE